MKYKIISTNALKGSIVIEYSTDGGELLSVQNFEVPIVSGKYITGALLDHEIMLRGPIRLEERINAVKQVTNFAEVEALIQASETAN